MLIHTATAADWARQRDIRLASLRADPDAFGSTLERELAFGEVQWRERIERADATLLAVLDGADVGIAVVAPSTTGPGDGGIYGVWVAPDGRGRGVGDALMRGCIEAARAAGYARLVLDVGDDNAPAIALYARHGFEPTGEVSALAPPREHITEHQRALVLESR